MPIINNAASSPPSRGENWVPTHSGDRERRDNGIWIKYYQEGSGTADWRARFENLPNQQPCYQVEGGLSDFVERVRNKADKLHLP